MTPVRQRPVLDRARSLLDGLIGRLAKFGVVGGIAFVVDVGLFNLLSYVGANPLLAGQPLLAKAVSTTIATIIAWLGNRYWTFRHTRRDEVGREFALYAVMCAIGLGISLGCLWVSHYLLGFTSPLADNIAANVIGLVAGTVFRFWAYQRFVFVKHADPVVDADAAADLTAVTGSPSNAR
jgi:putative flippase GtrA